MPRRIGELMLWVAGCGLALAVLRNPEPNPGLAVWILPCPFSGLVLLRLGPVARRAGLTAGVVPRLQFAAAMTIMMLAAFVFLLTLPVFFLGAYLFIGTALG